MRFEIYTSNNVNKKKVATYSNIKKESVFSCFKSALNVSPAFLSFNSAKPYIYDKNNKIKIIKFSKVIYVKHKNNNVFMLNKSTGKKALTQLIPVSKTIHKNVVMKEKVVDNIVRFIFSESKYRLVIKFKRINKTIYPKTKILYNSVKKYN